MHTKNKGGKIMKIQLLEEFDFDEKVLDSKGIVVVKMYGAWCGPCKMLASILSQMPDMPGLTVYDMDVDKNITLCKQFGVMSVPTLLFFKDGAYLDKVVGFRSQSQLTELFETYLQSGK